MVSKILYLRQQYHFGAGRIADYLRRFHQVAIARSTSADANRPAIRQRGSLSSRSSSLR
jgi:hypothetical protein